MKKFYVICTFLVMALLSGCDNKESDPYAGDFFPRIFDPARVFTSPSMVIAEGASAQFKGLLFSPANQVSISWQVDGKEVSTDTSFTFTPTAGGEYHLTLAVSHQGDTAYRRSTILVSSPVYTPKTYDHVVMPYLSSTGTAASVNWAAATHVAYQAARVLPDGSLDLQAAQTNQAADELVARAHLNGVAVLLGICGHHSGVDGWALYESNDFGNAISHESSRHLLVEATSKFVNEKFMDGVDLMMTDVNSGQAAANIKAIGPFLAELRAALPSKLITVTVTTNGLVSEYPDLSKADWINVHAFENGLTVGPGAPIGQPSPLNYMIDCATLWKNKGYPASKLVIGLPAFGLQYTALDENGHNLSWGSYGYLPYSDILAADAEADQKDFVSLEKGVYYNGIPLIKQKVAYLKANGFKGTYLWAGDYDVMGEKSLLGAIYQNIN
ncbi:Chitinase, GH18 family [bacterium A37T11]|nr:Chitinase, GH18 family [bacterium A37T11]